MMKEFTKFLDEMNESKESFKDCLEKLNNLRLSLETNEEIRDYPEYLKEIESSISSYMEMLGEKLTIENYYLFLGDFNNRKNSRSVGEEVPEAVKNFVNQYEEVMAEALHAAIKLFKNNLLLDQKREKLNLPNDHPLKKMLDNNEVSLQDVISCFKESDEFKKEDELQQKLTSETKDMSSSHPLNMKFAEYQAADLGVEDVSTYSKSQEYFNDYHKHISNKTDSLIRRSKREINSSFEELYQDHKGNTDLKDLLNALEIYINEPLSEVFQKELQEKIDNTILDVATHEKFEKLSQEISKYAEETFALIQDVSSAPEKESQKLTDELNKARNFLSAGESDDLSESDSREVNKSEVADSKPRGILKKSNSSPSGKSVSFANDPSKDVSGRSNDSEECSMQTLGGGRPGTSPHRSDNSAPRHNTRMRR